MKIIALGVVAAILTTLAACSTSPVQLAAQYRLTSADAGHAAGVYAAVGNKAGEQCLTYVKGRLETYEALDRTLPPRAEWGPLLTIAVADSTYDVLRAIRTSAPGPFNLACGPLLAQLKTDLRGLAGRIRQVARTIGAGV